MISWLWLLLIIPVGLIMFFFGVALCNSSWDDKSLTDGENGPSTIETLESGFEFYSVCSSRAGHAEARMKCLSCGAVDLSPLYKYCPECGRMFNDGK